MLLLPFTEKYHHHTVKPEEDGVPPVIEQITFYPGTFTVAVRLCSGVGVTFPAEVAVPSVSIFQMYLDEQQMRYAHAELTRIITANWRHYHRLQCS